MEYGRIMCNSNFENTMEILIFTCLYYKKFKNKPQNIKDFRKYI